MRYLILVICCCLILIFALLLHQNFIKEDDHDQINNRCIMTYMWRRMFFLDIGLEHPRYSLFLYGEGFYAQKFGSTGILNGIPILFVPGNGGSGRQVRSIGSLLQNKTEKMGTSFHFDTFSLDFNEELTALDFEYIHSQSEFLLIAIDWIWSLYEERPPAGIVLIGHSMGGIIIQAAVMNEKFKKEKVSFILTFATPYSEAPIYFDKNFYNFWEKMHKINPIKKIISISGGLKDEFIEEIWTNSTAVAVHSPASSIDRVWLDMDHQCILWCNQLVRQTSRLLFDFALDPKAFLGNFQNFAYRHYESIGFQLKPLNENNSIKIDEKSQFILLISAIGNEPIDELINFNKCGKIHEITRYLDANNLFTFVNLTYSTLEECEAKIGKNVKFWMMKEEEIFKPKLELNLQHKFTTQFSMGDSPLGIIPLNFIGNNFLIYQIKINRICKNELPHRMFFMENGRIRRANEINQNGQFSSTLLIYSNNAIENEYKLIIIDPNKCNKYSMQFSIHFRLTIIKAFRYNRHILPFSIALIFIYYSMPIKTILLNTFSIVLIALFFQNTSEPLRIAFILLFDAIFFILAYLICILMIRPILNKYSNGIGPTVSPKFLIWNFLIFFIAFFTGNSSIPAIFLAFKNIKFFNNLFDENDLKFMSMVGLQFCSLIIQIPSIWAHIWNLMKYGGEWNTKSDPFFESNLTMMIFILFLDFIFLIKISHPKFYSKIYYLSNLILFIFVIFIFNRNSACIFIMDDLSLLINLFLIHKIFYQMKYKI